MSDTYTATGQRHAIQAKRPLDSYVGLMRFDLLLSEWLGITDTDLMDGPLFLRLGPRRMTELVGRGAASRWLPFEIQARSGSLEDSIVSSFFRTDEDFLNCPLYNVISDPLVRDRLCRAIAKKPAEELTKRLRAPLYMSVIAFLREILAEIGAGDSASDLDRVESGWASWIEADETGRLRKRVWSKPFPLGDALWMDMLDVDDSLVTGFGRSVFSEVLALIQRSTRWSDVTNFLSERAAITSDEAAHLDLATVARWYEQGRHRAFAIQHDALFEHVEHIQAPTINPVTPRVREFVSNGHAFEERLHLRLPTGFAASLARLSGEEFGAYSAFAHDELQSFWDSGQPDQLNAALEKLDSVVPRHESGFLRLPLKVVATFGGGLAGASLDAKWGGGAGAALSFILVEGADHLVRRSSRPRLIERVVVPSVSSAAA